MGENVIRIVAIFVKYWTFIRNAIEVSLCEKFKGKHVDIVSENEYGPNTK